MANEPIHEAEILREAEMLGRVDGDAELLVELIGIFLDDAGPAIQEVLEAAAIEDAARLERAAHKFKGSMSLFSCEGKALASVLALETMGRTRDLRDAKSACFNFQKQAATLIEDLTALKDKYVESSAGGR
jgi:HPt (histidine-containing phosphotransfer) domain-containing protein